ncbi:MAG: slipin family protein [Agriterribacter sp.]
MKNVKVNAYQRGLVFKNEAYQRMLTEGSYWFWGNEVVKLYDITQAFNAPVELNILLQDAALADALIVLEVKDNEIALQYKNGLLEAVFTAGRYAFWKGAVNYAFVKADTGKLEITEPVERNVLLHRLVAPFVRSASVESFEKAVLFIDGKFVQVLQPGVYYWWKNAIAVHVGKIDTRQQQLEINGQEILTRDKAALRINAWAQYKVADIEKALLQNKEYEKQLYVTFQLVLREYIAGFGFDELLEKKDTLVPFVLQQVKAKADVLGVEVTGFGIRDIILPGDVKEIMNQVLVAEKKAQANTIIQPNKL